MEESTNPDIFTIIKKLRVNISMYSNSIQLLEPSREISLVNTSLQRSFAWLGKTLEYLGSKSPYTESENPASKSIEPVADTSELTLMEYWVILEPTQTARVKDFRSKLQDTITELEPVVEYASIYLSWKAQTSTKEVFISLTDAKMWLGWELGRIKKQVQRPAPRC